MISKDIPQRDIDANPLRTWDTLENPNDVPVGAERELTDTGQLMKNSGVNGWQPVGSINTTTAGGLAGIKSAGVTISITDFGGTIAMSDGVRWRLDTLVLSWKSLPLASVVPVGTQARITDLNNQVFVSNGTSWRPRNGRALLYQKHGSVDTPLSTLSGITTALFLTPDTLKIPAGLIAPHSKIGVMTEARKTGENGTCVFSVTLGTTNTLSDAPVSDNTSLITSLVDLDITASARFGTPTNKFFIRGGIGDGQTLLSTPNAALDVSANVNTAIDMYVSLGVRNANALDSFSLYGYSIWIEG